MSSYVIERNGEQDNRIVEEYQDMGREGKKTGERTEWWQKETGRERWRWSWISLVSSYKGTNLVRAAPLSRLHLNLITSQRPLPRSNVPLGVSTSSYGFRGHKYNN